RRILVRDHGSYVKGPGFERVKLLLGNGIFVSDGAHWRRARTMAQPGFTRRKLRGLIDLILDRVAARAAAWDAQIAARVPIDITTEMSDFALDLILRAIFGEDFDETIMASGENPFAFLAEEFSRDINLVVKFRALRDLMLEVIGMRRARGETDGIDFLSVYLSAVDKEGRPFSDRELLDEIMTRIIAGFETSAGTLNWAWYLTAAHPRVAERIVAEVNDVIGKDEVDNDRLGRLDYLECALNETMRLYPPGWIFSRRAIADTDIGDYDVPAGTDLYISPYILHRSEDFWPEPECFDPERFRDGRADGLRDSAFIPFSLGPRRCIGEYFAMLEMKINLALLMPRFRMTPHGEETPGLDLGINLRSRGSILLDATRR
ncbi:MAG: cytochrome P450, partial [Woeseiaceae bacterium]|nr:cytochrome P450 [Woeseiaceae bacterium]